MKHVIATIIILGILSISHTALAATPSSPFIVYGYVFNNDGSECNYPKVNVTNLNISKEWDAGRKEGYNYYQIILTNGTDINASEVLRFNVTSPDGSQSNITEHTVTPEEINNGGFFGFNISLSIQASGLCGDVNRVGGVNMGDVGALHNYVQYGYPISDEWAANVNCAGGINMGDVGALHNHVQYGYPLNCCVAKENRMKR
ncbi:hypothetical protein C5S39_01900 [Candidatus Methanophagaceae archaeon]|nr:hypothetical protein C5S39_01900 [Methanophagales archaeon]